MLHAKGFSSRTCNTPRPAMFHAKGLSGLLFKTSNASSCSSSNVQQQQPSTFQLFIDFERATAATFYFPMIYGF
eukprot:2076476-Rhodomonas_salina.1